MLSCVGTKPKVKVSEIFSIFVIRVDEIIPSEYNVISAALNEESELEICERKT
jgi:hypothetical protein